MKKRNVLNSPRLLELKKRRRKIVFARIGAFLFFFIIIFFSLAYLSRLKSLNINEIVILGNNVTNPDAVKATVEQTIAGKYLLLFPKSNVLMYPKSKIKSTLENTFKEIKNVDLSIKDSQALVVSLTEREAKYMWCGNTFPETNNSNEKCYFLDSDGYIFEEAPYFSGEVYFKFYGPIDPPLGSFFFKQYFSEFVSFRDVLVNMGLKPVAMNIIKSDQAEIILSKGPTATVSPKIIFDPSVDLKNTEENLDAALHTEPLQSKFEKKYSSLEYIDLRYGNRVYDKFQ